MVHDVGDCKAQLGPQHDVIWFAVKGRKFAFPGKRPKSVIRCQRLVKTTHPNEKPVEQLKQLVVSVTPAGGKVLEPFTGSGAGSEACLSAGFEYVGIELDPVWHRLSSEREAGFAERVA